MENPTFQDSSFSLFLKSQLSNLSIKTFLNSSSISLRIFLASS